MLIWNTNFNVCSQFFKAYQDGNPDNAFSEKLFKILHFPFYKPKTIQPKNVKCMFMQEKLFIHFNIINYGNKLGII